MPHLSRDRLPAYLQKFIVPQRYERYTPEEQATWRFIMRQSGAFFAKHSVPVYEAGLRETGLSVERIPRIEEIDEHMQRFGWGAVGICGFIPPAAFLDFEARRIMPIAMDMRTIDHIGYTPAPDIVHEAAGHVPILWDEEYREYLRQYALMANRSIISREDIDLYEAVRILSDIKENPDTTTQQIASAEQAVKDATAKMTHVSELAEVARMAWWTAEYGLVGSLESPKIYGAGLLSSIAESQHCLSPKVRKLRLSIDCIRQGYDITEPQPQLFVADSFKHLVDVLEDLSSTLAYRRGGKLGMERARVADTVNTVVLESGISISGIVEKYLTNERDEVIFFKLRGPTQISFDEKELPGQGRVRHAHGFSSPVGAWKKAKNPSKLSDSELRAAGLAVGSGARLEFASGFVVEGNIVKFHREAGALVYMTWTDCRVSRGGETFFDPSWGEFDMVVGTSVTSVHGGPADRVAYGDYEYGNISTVPGRSSPFSEDEKSRFELYADLRAVRESGNSTRLDDVAKGFFAKHPSAWLAGVELLELQKKFAADTKLTQSHLQALAVKLDRADGELLQKGIDLASTSSER